MTVKWHRNQNVPRDGAYYRISYGFGQESILKWCVKKKWWVDFDGDRHHIEADNGNDSIGMPEAWQPYVYPGKA